MEIVFTILALLIMCIGFIGTFIPAIPGTGMIFFTALIYAIFTNFSNITVNVIIILGMLTAVSLVLQYIASIITTKKVGASKYGIIGAVLGGIVGFMLLNIFGLILGQFVGAIIGEMLKKTELKKSLKVGIATFIGYILGVLTESTIAIIMIVVFVLKIVL